MIDKGLDTTLIKLKIKYQELDQRAGEINSEIEGLQDEIEDLECEQTDIENEMAGIKERMAQIKNKELVQKIEELNIVSDDTFIQDFIKASYFTEKLNIRPILNLVNVTDNEIQAVDGYKAIVIKNMDIPKELQNHKFSWTVRENFKSNISDRDNEEFINLHSIIPKENDAKYAAININSDNFYETFDIKECKEGNIGKVVLLNYQDFNIACKKEYIDDSLLVLKGETFSVFFYSDVSPILLKTERAQIILLPVRIRG